VQHEKIVTGQFAGQKAKDYCLSVVAAGFGHSMRVSVARGLMDRKSLACQWLRQVLMARLKKHSAVPSVYQRVFVVFVLGLGAQDLPTSAIPNPNSCCILLFKEAGIDILKIRCAGCTFLDPIQGDFRIKNHQS
jgi:hypothetical protein